MDKFKKLVVRGLTAVLVTGLLLGGLTGCSSDSTTADEDTTGEKYLRVSLYSYPGDLEPTNGYFGWGLTRLAVGETLVKFDENMETAASISDEWSQVDDTTWKFHIREGVTFHNGNTCDATAVMNSLQRSMDMSTRAASIANIASMEVSGEDLIIKTNGVYGAFLSYMAEPVFVIVDTSVDTSDYANKPICTGPFMVESFEAQVNIHLVKYSDYWGGEAQTDVVDVPYVQDANARAMALEAGEIDIAQEIVNSDLTPFEDNENYIIYTCPSTKTIFSYVNSASQFLSDATLRKAISYGIDRDLYASSFIGGETATGPFSTVMGWGNENLTVDTYDEAAAIKLLDDAGYLDADGDGYREMNGEKISIELGIAGKSDVTIYKAMSEAMQAQLKNIGIEMTITITEIDFETDVTEPYDLMYKHVNPGSTNDPQNFLDLYFSTEGTQNLGNYSSPEFDALLAELKTTVDENRRIEIAEEASQLLLDDTAALFLGYPDYNIVTTNAVEDLTQYPINFYLLDQYVTIN